MARNENKIEKREAILKAASIAFTDRRFDEVKLDEIAKLAGVGKGTLYLYFKNKEELFVELAGVGLEEMSARIREILSLDLSYIERFKIFVYEVSEFARERHVWRRAIIQSSSKLLNKEVHPKRELVRDAVYEFLQAGVDEGVIPADVSIKSIHCIVMGSLFFRGRPEPLPDMEVDLDELILCYLRIFKMTEGLDDKTGEFIHS